ncbi:MAG: S9 family peptidase [Fimbriimonadaceae bacterium]|nr:S9 family peptidase [Fimbriimonadaceae bacterium]QYK56982.1 MAG: S9 family peptidase [Fimbriimonadaceae bacterium]
MNPVVLFGLLFFAMPDQIEYPQTKKGDVVDTYHGVKVPDPYRWLEQPNTEPDVAAWIAAQNAVSFGFLDKIEGRDRLYNELRRRLNFERFSVPTLMGGKVFYTRNDGLQNQDVLYVADSVDAPGRVLLDPNTFSEDGTVALSGLGLSEDGKTLVYGKSSAGSDWTTFYTMDVATGDEKSAPVPWTKFSEPQVDREGKGFYYLRWPKPTESDQFVSANKSPEIRYHAFGVDPDEDRLVYSLPDKPDWFIGPYMDGTRTTLWIIIHEPGSINNTVSYIDLTQPDAKAQPLFSVADADYTPIYREGDSVWVMTTKDAPTGKIVKVSLKEPSAEDWKTVVPAGKDTIQAASVVHHRLLVTRMHDVKTAADVFTVEGERLTEIEMPGPGTASGFSGQPDDKVTFFSYTDLKTPATIYKYDVAEGKAEVYRKPDVPIDTDRYETKQVFVTGKDGARVPMFLVHRKGIKLDGTNPTLLYGYGGFNVSLQPWFSSARTVWMDMGGVWAMANIRGGGEYGKEWHEAAIKTNRQRAYDDFIACAEWLISEKYTKPARLAVQGGSNGGLLVGAVMTQRPELFGVAVPEVGVMDMLRFNQFTIGKAWESDYGSPENEEEFKALLRISPYHNLKPGVRYPATLVTTADTDDRVVPAHSFKFAARLQEVQAKDGPPVLIRIETSAGHGGGKPTTKVLEEVRDVFAFILHEMGIKIPASF